MLRAIVTEFGCDSLSAFGIICVRLVRLTSVCKTDPILQEHARQEQAEDGKTSCLCSTLMKLKNMRRYEQTSTSLLQERQGSKDKS